MVLTVGISLLIVLGYYVGRAYFLKPGLVQGQKAIEIVDKLPDGSAFALSDLKGKYVLLDFWGTWCGPCIQSHPALVELYKKYNGQTFTDGSDFEIVSVAVESHDRNWRNVISQDHLSWPYHVLAPDLFHSPVVRSYGVKQLPTKFLVNPKGIIVGVNPSMSQIDKLLRERLK